MPPPSWPWRTSESPTTSFCYMPPTLRVPFFSSSANAVREFARDQVFVFRGFRGASCVSPRSGLRNLPKGNSPVFMLQRVLSTHRRCPGIRNRRRHCETSLRIFRGTSIQQEFLQVRGVFLLIRISRYRDSNRQVLRERPHDED